MKSEKIVLKAQANEAGELIIRHGLAAEIREQEKVVIEGPIVAPGQFLENRKDLYEAKNCSLLVNRESGKLWFRLNDKSYSPDSVSGEMRLNSDLLVFGINAEKFYTSKDLAKLFRKMVYFFADKSENKKIVNSLMKFDAKVNTVIEDHSDNRGNVKKLLLKTVETDVPETFTLKLAIYQECDVVEFPVEIGAEADSTGVRFYLESADLYILLLEQRQAILEREIEPFKKWGCVVIDAKFD